jgi:hypothetical protein
MSQKPEKGLCSRCKSTELTFQDDGQGICNTCGRQFWWDPSRNPNPFGSQADTNNYPQDYANSQTGTYEALSAETLKTQMEHELEVDLPKDEDLAQLERMRRLGRMYNENRISKELYRSKMDMFKAEFHS